MQLAISGIGLMPLEEVICSAQDLVFIPGGLNALKAR